MYLIRYKLVTSTTQIYVTRNFSNSIFSGNFPFRCKQPQKQWYCLKSRVTNFHTTGKMHSPAFVMLNIASIISGFYLRNWWLKQTPMKREEYLKWYKNRRFKIHGSLAVISFVVIAYCLTFVERDPVVKRARFVVYNKAEQARYANTLFQVIVRSRDNMVPLNDPMYFKIDKVMRNLARANKDLLENTNWNITIVNHGSNILNPTIMILPDGNIIVFSDLFKFVKNDDQLTFDLAHEIAHQMLLHTVEGLSFELLGNILLDIVWFLWFAFYPIWTAFMLSTAVFAFFQSIICWYSRHCELEADKIGFELSARSCIDLREVFIFWELIKNYRDFSYVDKLFNFSLFNIHPSIEDRVKRLNDDLPKALQLRHEANCPELPNMDPRDNLPRLLKELEDNLRTDLGSLRIQL